MKPTVMTDLTPDEQVAYRAQWLARQEFITAFKELCRAFTEVTGCSRRDIVKNFIASGHQFQYDAENPTDTTERKIKQAHLKGTMANKARRSGAESLMNAEELRSVIARMDICVKGLRQRGKCSIELARFIHQQAGLLVRRLVSRDHGFFPEEFPVAQWLLTAEDVADDPPPLTENHQGRLW